MVRAISLALLLTAIAPVGDVAAQTLRGSRVTMERQNEVARTHDYSFLQTPAQVRRFVDNGLLVRVPGNADYALASVSHPYARPAVKTFLERLGAQYRAACGERLVVTSLTRPVRQQPRNASDLSVHPAGMAVDLRVSNRSSCRSWLERTLLSLEKQRVIDATRERRPAHYHVAVFPSQYLAYVERLEDARPPVRLASSKAKAPTRLAALPPEPEPVQVADPGTSQADAFDAAEEALAMADGDAPPEAEGQKGGDVGEYRVNRGDTLWTIARRHGTTVEELKQLNQLRSSRIAAGQVLTVPAETAAQ